MKHIVLSILLIAFNGILCAQPDGYWRDKERTLRYHPEGEDFVIVNGAKKFNRALYGTNTAFRIETGDMPEFGLFMPNMGGNIQLGLIAGDRSIWLNNAEYIKSIYRPGARIYEIKDPLLGEGGIVLNVLAMDDAEGMIVKVECRNLPPGMQLVTLFGGADNKRFSRNGDLGVDDPDAFGLRAEACEGNEYSIDDNRFTLTYAQNQKGGGRGITGVFPTGSELKTGSPYRVASPLSVQESAEEKGNPVLTAMTPLAPEMYILLKARDVTTPAYPGLKDCFDRAERKRKEIAGSITINTPDPYFNTLGGALAIAADGIWDDDTGWQHGAIGWRMPLNGWRAAYVGDAAGWHERARKHFDGYAASQITDIEPQIPHPAQDKALNLARAEKTWGTQMYSNGYITRNPGERNKMHHYDMNMVFIDELLWHFNWTGDRAYIRKMWPVLKRHLAWEKRNFDPDDDGLYDAYACIWASDALQYNSGGVTHSSAYNYRANKMAAGIAREIGEDPAPYEAEAAKILNAINSELWLPEKGWWAEYKDFMGNKTVHPNAALWTVYHAIDSDVHTPFQAWQATRYIDSEIPHIPVRAKGLEDEGYHTLSTTNWLPYSWSINNVAFAEVAHTSLAYWQAGRKEEAFGLFKSLVLDGMYLGSSPGNIGQVSFYDAARGECYRDFGDPVGIYARALIQGLFGILPDAMNNRLVVRPGFPSRWNHASVSTPDVTLAFSRTGNTDTYEVDMRFEKELNLELLVNARKDNIASVRVNGEDTPWTLSENGIGAPLIRVDCKTASRYEIEIVWSGNRLKGVEAETTSVKGHVWSMAAEAGIQKVFDPQRVLDNTRHKQNTWTATTTGETGQRTVFVQLQQGTMRWWEPVCIEVQEPFRIDYDPEAANLKFDITNNGKTPVDIELTVNSAYSRKLRLKGKETYSLPEIPGEYARMGTNSLRITEGGEVVFETNLINQNLKNTPADYEVVDMDKFLNAPVDRIFRNEYLSPRSPFTTLQVPKQGIGEWCHPALTAGIDDSGLRKAVREHVFRTPPGIPFRTTGQAGENNIAFTTLWDNYPDSVTVPLSGKASHAYLLMAGSTNHMQCHVVNGTVEIIYTDGGNALLNLVNPETWAPIEQDFYSDGYAFTIRQPRPYRVALKSGVVSRDLGQASGIKPDEVYGRAIDGGAAIILDMPLDAGRELKEVRVKAVANEVVIGLMGITLLR